jgi:hypothetical protein
MRISSNSLTRTLDSRTETQPAKPTSTLPNNPPVIKPTWQTRLHHREIRRHIEIPRHKKRNFSRAKNLHNAIRALRCRRRKRLHQRQNRKFHTLKSPRHQHRTNRPRRLPAAQHQRPAPPFLRHRQRQQIPHQIKHIPQIIRMPQTADHIRNHRRPPCLIHPHRPADPRMKPGKLRRPHQPHPIHHIRLHEARHAVDLPHIHRRMRPGALRHVFDHDGKPAGPFHQHHIRRPQRRQQ